MKTFRATVAEEEPDLTEYALVGLLLRWLRRASRACNRNQQHLRQRSANLNTNTNTPVYSRAIQTGRLAVAFLCVATARVRPYLAGARNSKGRIANREAFLNVVDENGRSHRMHCWLCLLLWRLADPAWPLRQQHVRQRSDGISYQYVNGRLGSLGINGDMENYTR